MYAKSLKALEKVEKMMVAEKKKFETEKKVYEEQIKKLKMKIEFKKPNIGHLYCYKEFAHEKLVPETLILERNDENHSDIDVFYFDREKGEQVIDRYLRTSGEEE